MSSKKWIDAQSEYDKDPNLKEEDVKMLLEWCKKEQHLPEVSEMEAILFLHSCYYRLEAAKTTLDNFFTIKTHCPELFCTLSEEILAENLPVLMLAPLQQRTSKDEVVFLARIMDPRPEKFDCTYHMNFTVAATILHLHQYGIAEGFHVVVDMKATTLGYLPRIHLGSLRKLFYCVQETIPIRIKGLHIINTSPITGKFISVIKPFMKNDLLSMLSFHPDYESLFKLVPREVLPNDYGGYGPSLAEIHKYQCKRIFDNLDFFKEMDLRLVDESKRVGKSKDINEIFGMEGTFKKLEVD